MQSFTSIAGKITLLICLKLFLIIGVMVMLKMVLVELDLEVAGASKLDVALVTSVMYLRKMALFVEVI